MQRLSREVMRHRYKQVMGMLHSPSYTLTIAVPVVSAVRKQLATHPQLLHAKSCSASAADQPRWTATPPYTSTPLPASRMRATVLEPLKRHYSAKRMSYQYYLHGLLYRASYCSASSLAWHNRTTRLNALCSVIGHMNLPFLSYFVEQHTIASSSTLRVAVQSKMQSLK